MRVLISDDHRTLFKLEISNDYATSVGLEAVLRGFKWLRAYDRAHLVFIRNETITDRYSFQLYRDVSMLGSDHSIINKILEIIEGSEIINEPNDIRLIIPNDSLMNLILALPGSMVEF